MSTASYLDCNTDVYTVAVSYSMHCICMRFCCRLYFPTQWPSSSSSSGAWLRLAAALETHGTAALVALYPYLHRCE